MGVGGGGSAALISRLDRLFALRAQGTSVRTEITAGVTTFMTMAYILFANPEILGAAGMDPQAVLMATALSAGLATIFMGLFANLPFALAPGMGLNAYFAFSIVLGMGIPWQVVLGAVFLDGLLFFVISLLPIREKIIQEIPLNLKIATSAAIGLFIAFIGFQNAGLVVADENTLVALGNLTEPGNLLGMGGLLLTGVLLAYKVRGALVWGIIGTTIAGMFIKVQNAAGQLTSITPIPTALSDVIARPDFAVLSQTFMQLDIRGAIGLGVLLIIFTFTFVDFFDTAGTLIGLSTKLDIIDEKGSFPGAGRALVVDAVATMAGAVLGTSTVTAYVESASGVGEGGRTGLTSVVTGLLFVASVFLWPLAGVIPAQATAPALIIVGLLMLEPIRRLNLDDYTEALPAFLTILLMPLTYSIAHGLVFGIVSYALLKLLSGRGKEVTVTVWIMAVLLIALFGFGIRA